MVFNTVIDKKKLNTLGAAVASLFATLIPVVLALQPDVTMGGSSSAALGCNATADQELAEVRYLVAVLDAHMSRNVSNGCLQNRTLASLFSQV